MVIIDFVTQKAQTGRLPGTTAQVNSFIGGVRCYAGLDPNTFLIQPTDQPQTINNQQGNSGVSLQGNTVTVPTLLTITLLDQNLPPGIQTKLDQYPTFISITTSSTLTKPAVVAICLGQAVPVSVFARLHLGHQKTSGFEITPSADPTFLNCPTSLGSTSRIPEWMRSLANVVLPKKLFAWQEQMLAGGVGGVATEFSPFDAVDPGAFMTGGVGGVATEFQRTRAGGLRGSTAPSSTATPSVAAPKGGTR